MTISTDSLSTTDRTDLLQSLKWVDENIVALRGCFFGHLFERHPEVRERFANHSRPQQAQMLQQILGAVRDSLDAPDATAAYLADTGDRHLDYDVHAQMYDQVAECLLETLVGLSEDSMSERHIELWRERLNWVSRAAKRELTVENSTTGDPGQPLETSCSEQKRASFASANLLCLDLHSEDPWDFYAWLRDEQPLFWDVGNEFWAVSRYEDLSFVSKRTDLFCNGKGVVPQVGLDIWPDEAMINLDGDAHTCQRGLVAKGFAARRIEALEPMVRERLNALVDKMLVAGEADLVLDLARPLPFQIIAELLGYADPESTEVLDWTDTYVAGGNGIDSIDENVVEAFANFCMFHEELLAEKKSHPGDDLLNVWMNAELDGKRLGEDKLLYEHNLLLVGGSETTRSAISMGFAALLEHPEQLEWLRERVDDADVMGRAVEEMIRWSCPFVRMARTATQDVHMHGKTIKADQQVLLLYPAANRDPRVFEKADEFNIHIERPMPSLSFGVGKHYCLGSSLARMEIRLSLEILLTRCGNLRLSPDKARTRARSCFVRSLTHCPVQL